MRYVIFIDVQPFAYVLDCIYGSVVVSYVVINFRESRVFDERRLAYFRFSQNFRKQNFNVKIRHHFAVRHGTVLCFFKERRKKIIESSDIVSRPHDGVMPFGKQIVFRQLIYFQARRRKKRQFQRFASVGVFAVKNVRRVNDDVAFFHVVKIVAYFYVSGAGSNENYFQKVVFMVVFRPLFGSLKLSRIQNFCVESQRFGFRRSVMLALRSVG